MAVNDIVYWVWYSQIKGISSEVKLKLTEMMESPKELFLSSGECLRRQNISPKIIDKISRESAVDNIERYVRLLEKCTDISIVTYYDCKYPRLLCEIHNPPLVLYYKGDIELFNSHCIAVVGTRNATTRGKYHARSFAQEFAAQGYTVVSGMAKGIDASAHVGALSTGKTCAVLGCGVDVVYPAENKELYNRICADGLVISEFLPGTSPQRWSFPVRNRIISGLCESTLLIEAPEKSGAINTVEHALEQNRDVYVLFDNGNSVEFSGNRKLIEDGAVAVSDPYEIMNRADFSVYDSVKTQNLGIVHTATVFNASEQNGEKTTKEEKDTSLLSQDEIAVYNLIKSGVRHFDEIVNMSQLDISDVGIALTMLEFNGFIVQKLGKMYETV